MRADSPPVGGTTLPLLATINDSQQSNSYALRLKVRSPFYSRLIRFHLLRASKGTMLNLSMLSMYRIMRMLSLLLIHKKTISALFPTIQERS
jgi:hypothetical protein